jgi:DNA-binding GntR family transcriptional regulator
MVYMRSLCAKCSGLSMSGNGKRDKQRKKTIAESVRLQLEDEIVSGVHPPGCHLDETEMADWLGCSRTPLREVLSQLVAVGLLERRPHCGVFVLPLAPAHARALAEACGELDALCAVLAGERLPLDARRVLESRAAEDPSGLWWTIRHGCGNAYLAEQADMMAMKLRPYLILLGDAVGSRLGLAAAQLAQAVAGGDGEAAGRIARGHWRELGEAAITALSPSITL